MSAPRRWLREERASLRPELDKIWHMECWYTLGAVSLALESRSGNWVDWVGWASLREPTADLHIHGRDCDAWWTLPADWNPGSSLLMDLTETRMCGVEGEWR